MSVFFANYAKYAIVKFSKKRAWPKQKAVDLRHVQGPCTGELFKTKIYGFQFFTLATLTGVCVSMSEYRLQL